VRKRKWWKLSGYWSGWERRQGRKRDESAMKMGSDEEGMEKEEDEWTQPPLIE